MPQSQYLFILSLLIKEAQDCWQANLISKAVTGIFKFASIYLRIIQFSLILKQQKIHKLQFTLVCWKDSHEEKNNSPNIQVYRGSPTQQIWLTDGVKQVKLPNRQLAFGKVFFIIIYILYWEKC